MSLWMKFNLMVFFHTVCVVSTGISVSTDPAVLEPMVTIPTNKVTEPLLSTSLGRADKVFIVPKPVDDANRTVAGIPTADVEEVAAFTPTRPGTFLHLEKVGPVRRIFFDATDYGESAEVRKVPLAEKPAKSSTLRSGSLEVDGSDWVQDLGIPAGVDLLVTALETLPTHPAVALVDTWAQETQAGFLGYFERLGQLWERDSTSVENKLFAAADAYSHRFFNLVHVKEADHPVLAAKMTRIILAMVLSLSLVFIIFGLALHLQRTLVAKAHEEASKQLPAEAGEQLFFAMPYPHLREGGVNDTNIVIVHDN